MTKGALRIAVVVPTPNVHPLWLHGILGYKSCNTSQPESPTWTATVAAKCWEAHREAVKNEGLWANALLEAANCNIEALVSGENRPVGIECPVPLGIVTFEDIIDTILQKTSRDERDIFDRGNAAPLTKIRKVGVNPPAVLQRMLSSEDSGPPLSSPPMMLPKAKEQTSLRRRNGSGIKKLQGGLDGIDERSNEGSINQDIHIRKTRASQGESVYTENSRFDLCGSGDSALPDPACSTTHAVNLDPGLAAELTSNPLSPSRGNFGEAANRPSYQTRTAAILPGSFLPLWGYTSEDAAPRIPQLRHLSPVSGQYYSRLDRTPKKQPLASEAPLSSSPTVPIRSHVIEKPAISTKDDIEMAQTEKHKPIPCQRSRTIDTIDLKFWLSENLADLDGRALYGSKIIDDVPRLRNPEETTMVDDNALVLKTKVTQTGDISATETCDWLPTEPHNIIKENHSTTTLEERKPTDTVANAPYNGFPPDLLDISKENQLNKYKPATVPRNFGPPLDADASTEGDLSNEYGLRDDRANLPSQRKRIDTQIIPVGPRSSSLWY